MRDRIGRNGGVSYDGPRAFIVGLVAFCAGCVVIAYGTDRITAAFGPAEPAALPTRAVAAAPSGGPSTPAEAMTDGARAQPVRFGAPVSVDASSGQRAALVGAARRPNAKLAPITTGEAIAPARAVVHAAPPVTAAPKPLTAPPVSIATPVAPASVATHAAVAALPHPVSRRRRWVVVRTVAPVARATPVARAADGVLVPFKNAAALTSNGLDPRPSGDAPLLINPAPAGAPSDAGSLHTR